MEPTFDPPASSVPDEPTSGLPVPAAVGSTGPDLDQLEADVAAVESAMESVDRIAGGTEPGPARAAQIDAVVSAQRFPLSAEAATAPAQVSVPAEDTPAGMGFGSQLVGDRLLDQ
jgi:hypothetical protein